MLQSGLLEANQEWSSHGMCCPVCWMVHIKDSLLLIGNILLTTNILS